MENNIDKIKNFNNADKIEITEQNQNQTFIETVVAHIGVSGQVIEKEEKEEQKHFSLKEYNKPRKTIKIIDKNFESIIEQLNETRIIVLSCVDQLVLDSVIVHILEEFNKTNGYVYKTLDFTRSETKNNKTTIDLLVSTYLANNKKQIVITNIVNEPTSGIFLESLFDISEQGTSLVNHLKANEQYIICLLNANHYELVKEFKEKEKSYPFSYQNISISNCLKELLIYNQFEPGEAQYYAHQFFELWEVSIDGSHSTDIQRMILQELNKGQNSFRKFISNKEKNINQESVTPQEIIKKNTYLGLTILYAATYFPRLGYREFRIFVEFLFEGEKVRIEQNKRILTPKGKQKKIKETVEKELIKLWKDTPDKHFTDCHLIRIKNDDLSELVEFTEIYLLNEIKSYLESQHPYFLSRQIEKIVKSDLLFNLQLSDRFAENIIRLIVDHALADSIAYGKNYLLEIVRSERFKDKYTLGDIDSDTDYDVLKMINYLHQVQRSVSMLRLVSLIREMLERPQLLPEVKDFFNQLIGENKTRFLLELIREVNFPTHLDKLFWIKQIIHRGKGRIKLDAYYYLLTFARQNPNHIWGILRHVNENWLPKLDKNRELNIISHKFGLLSLINYSSSIIYSLPLESYGQWPPKYILFSSFTEDDSVHQLEQYTFLISWLFHPQLEGTTFNNFDNYKPSIDKIGSNADLIEFWFRALRGYQEGTPNPNSTSIKILLNSLIDNTSAYTQRYLIKCWNDKKRYYLKELAKIQKIKSKEKIQIKKNRSLLKELVRTFKIYSK